ncbi:MAG: DUF4443 domain-containing protein [Promethearchaeota archaeon]
MFEEIEPVFYSTTIKPSFERVHVILALFIFGANKEGIGRYRLQKELIIGSGTARSLIKKLKKEINFITILSDEKGHILEKKGMEYLDKIKEKIPFIEPGDSMIIKDIVVRPEENYSYFCLVKNAVNSISNGIEQRDAAIKIGGIGATCLLYNGKYLIFPSQSQDLNEKSKMKVEDNIFEYIHNLIKKNKAQLEENDVIIIGSGENPENARLAALNAALTIV